MLLVLSRTRCRKMVIEECEEIAADETVREAPEAAEDSARDRVVIPQIHGTDDPDESCAIVTREHGHEGEGCHADREDSAAGEAESLWGKWLMHQSGWKYSMIATRCKN